MSRQPDRLTEAEKKCMVGDEVCAQVNEALSRLDEIEERLDNQKLYGLCGLIVHPSVNLQAKVLKERIEKVHPSRKEAIPAHYVGEPKPWDGTCATCLFMGYCWCKVVDKAHRTPGACEYPIERERVMYLQRSPDLEEGRNG